MSYRSRNDPNEIKNDVTYLKSMLLRVDTIEKYPEHLQELVLLRGQINMWIETLEDYLEFQAGGDL